jgi:hypothetical protein
VSSFYKTFLRDGLGWLQAGRPRVYLAAFGKHPAWDDHMDDIGLETESLVTLKRVLYLEGITRNLATGAWERLDDSARLPGFNHLFRWQRGSQFLVGTIMASRDGKGRSHYPLILCAHIIGPPAPIAATIEDTLRSLQAQCSESASAEQIRGYVNEALQNLRGAALSTKSSPASLPSIQLGELPELASFHPGKFRARNEPAASQARIARSAPPKIVDLEALMAAVQKQLDEDVPVLLLAPLFATTAWINLIAGNPGPGDFFCLRSSVAAQRPTE